jgi:glycosyltransferase involved in cell wall biosynthesis
VSLVLDNVSIIIPTAPDETEQQQLLNDLKQLNNQIIISAEGSRAKSLNVGAVKASDDFLWFLHADSRVSTENIFALEQALKKRSNVLHYFDLAYDGGHLTNSNSLGANIRSRLLGLPYGDQGFCISKNLFNKIGGYPENVPYGEDLLFIRLAKRAGIKLNRVPSKLLTSARKYKQHGWLKLTVLRQWQMVKLLRQNL